MKKIVIFGIKDFAELAYYYIKNDTKKEVVAFTVNREFIDKKEFCGLPVVPFEDIELNFPSNNFYLFAPMSPNDMNKKREKIYLEIKSKGYDLFTYVSSRCTNFSDSIGDNCFILEDNTLQPFVSIGNNVVIWSGNHIGHHSFIGDHTTITSHVVISGHCRIENNCFFGVNSTIKNNLLIKQSTFINMGSIITSNSEESSVYSPSITSVSSIHSSKIKF
jgi:sugar O-acyltransferase (sialic acid O-acetyltransferase NeuD family)